MNPDDPQKTTSFATPSPRSGPSLIGRVIGNYRIERELGRGGMGAVYEARHLHMDRIVAVKALLPAISGDQETLQRLFREQQILDGLRHANIVALHDVHVQDDGVFLVMEYIEGITLEEHIKRSGPMEPHLVTAIGQQLLAALAHTHARGVVHRDIKPGNIMLTRSDAKLLDFGIARATDSSKLTAPDMVFGSPAYLPPELWAGKEATPASDLYALALCLYEALMGQPALKSESGWQAYFALHTTGDIPRIDSRLPPRLHWLGEAIHRASRRNPAERYADAKDMLTVFRMNQGLSGEISLASLELDLAAPLDSSPDPSGPVAVQPSEVGTAEIQSPTLAQATIQQGTPRRWPWSLGIAGLSAAATVALIGILQAPSSTPERNGSPPQQAATVSTPALPATPDPPSASPPPRVTAPPTTEEAPLPPALEESAPRAIATAPPPSPEATPVPEAEPETEPTLEPALPAKTSRPCGDPGQLETRATEGRLGPDNLRCLEAALTASKRQTEQDRLSRYLLVDARARGDMSTWADLALRHLTDISQSDPIVCFQYAVLMRKEGRHSETIRWSDRALENKQDFPADKHANWVTTLLQYRAMAAHDTWFNAEDQYNRRRSTKDRNTANRAREQARTYAKEWYDFALEAGTNSDSARTLCHTVAGTSSLCP